MLGGARAIADLDAWRQRAPGAGDGHGAADRDRAFGEHPRAFTQPRQVVLGGGVAGVHLQRVCRTPVDEMGGQRIGAVIPQCCNRVKVDVRQIGGDLPDGVRQVPGRVAQCGFASVLHFGEVTQRRGA